MLELPWRTPSSKAVRRALWPSLGMCDPNVTTNWSVSSAYQDSVPDLQQWPFTFPGVADRPHTRCSIWGAMPGVREANSCSKAICWATPPSLASSLSPLMTGRKVAEDTLQSSGDSITPKTCQKERVPRVRGARISTPTQM